MQPQPIDLGRYRDQSYRVACDVRRARRYSTDPAKRGYYQRRRCERFARRFGSN